MICTLPGLTIEADLSRENIAHTLIEPMFLAGGLMLSQISQLTGLEPYTIQNWVKRGFVPPPHNKRYDRQQFCRIAIINMLKDCLRLDQISRLLSYLNGHLNDTSDNIIDDFRLYDYIIRLVAQTTENPVASRQERQSWCVQALEDYQEPFPGARDRVRRGLQVIITAYSAVYLKREAEQMLKSLDQ